MIQQQIRKQVKIEAIIKGTYDNRRNLRTCTKMNILRSGRSQSIKTWRSLFASLMALLSFWMNVLFQNGVIIYVVHEAL